jgi:hypothetical protein
VAAPKASSFSSSAPDIRVTEQFSPSSVMMQAVSNFTAGQGCQSPAGGHHFTTLP